MNIIKSVSLKEEHMAYIKKKKISLSEYVQKKLEEDMNNEHK